MYISGNSIEYVTQLINALPNVEDVAQRNLTAEEIEKLVEAVNAYRGLTEKEQEQILPELVQKLEVLDQKAAADGAYVQKVMEDFARKVDDYYSRNAGGAVALRQLEEAQRLLDQYDSYPETYKAVFDAMLNSQGGTYGEQMAALKEQTAVLQQQIEETESINDLIRELPEVIDGENAQDVLTNIAEIESRYEVLSEDGKTYVDMTVLQVLKRIAQGLIQQMEDFKGAAVANVQATVLSCRKVRISWNKYNKATGYVLQRRAGNGSWKTLRKLDSVTSYSDTSVKTGTVYTYRVRAISTYWGDSTITSKYGASDSARPVLAAVRLSGVKAYDQRTIKVTWKKVDDASGYEVYRSTSKQGKFKKVKDLARKSARSFTDRKLSKKTTYYYKVRAYRKVDGKKVYGNYSAVKGAKTKKK